MSQEPPNDPSWQQPMQPPSEEESAYTEPPSDYPVQVSFLRPDTSSRLLALGSIPWFLLRALLLIPHMIVLYFVLIAWIFAAWFGAWAVLFTGSYPRGLFKFNAGVIRWQTRASAYFAGLTDRYPPFQLRP